VIEPSAVVVGSTVINPNYLKDTPKQLGIEYKKCRTIVPSFYTDESGVLVQRLVVSPEHQPWNVALDNYRPPRITKQVVLDNDITINHQGWADPPSIDTVKPNGYSVRQEFEISQQRVEDFGFDAAAEMNAAEGLKLRFSHTGPLQFDSAGYPLNPLGRVGLDGRGSLGNWGPNHAGNNIHLTTCISQTVLTLICILYSRSSCVQNS
jgi:hypothetical protein